MSETIKLILMIFLVIGTFAFTLVITGWRMKKACDFILKDLKVKKAFDAASSAELPYGKSSIFRVGFRDYRPKALEQLIKQDMVRFTAGNRYYLTESGHSNGGPGGTTG